MDFPSNSVFTFNDKLHSQVDGVTIGSPLGPILADIFMNFNEKIWLTDCPIDFKPLYYKRYVDDTFLIFKDPSHIHPFLDYLNSKHPNIEFTCDQEKDSQLSFLDVLVTRQGSSFITNVYRKNTYTGLGLNFLSFVPMIYKVNSIKTLINRAYNVCSNWELFNLDLKLLQTFFLENSYPSFLFHKIVKNFLNKKFDPKPDEITAQKDLKYVKLPYMGRLSYDVKKNLQRVLGGAFPQINFRFVFINNFTIGSLLKPKSPIPRDLCSNITYLYTCSHCDMRYIGSTSRWFKHRYFEHRGLSYRTGFPLHKPAFSAIRQHSIEQDHPFTNTDFEILTFASDRLDLIISESLLIKKMKPELNSSSPFQLSLN